MKKWHVYAEISSSALTFFIAVLIGILAGQWLDAKLGGKGIFTVLLLVIAVGGAVANLLRAVRKLSAKK